MKLITMCRGFNLKIVEFLACFSKKLKYIYRTEFWRVLQINLSNWSKVKPIYTNPDSDYQKFVNACRFQNVATLCNKKVVEKANKLWKEMKHDKKQVCANFDYSSTRIKSKQAFFHLIQNRTLSPIFKKMRRTSRNVVEKEYIPLWHIT